MALHAVAMMAFFADAVQRGQLVLECAPAAPEPKYAWLVHSVFQLFLSVIPVAGGVWIADRSFKKNRQSEHEQWVRDQKKAEWRDLLSICGEVDQQYLLPYKEGDTPDILIKRIRNAYGQLHGMTMKCIFIAGSISNMSVEFDELLHVFSDGVERLESLRFNKRADIRIPEEYAGLIYAFRSVVGVATGRANLDLGIWKQKGGIIIPPDCPPAR